MNRNECYSRGQLLAFLLGQDDDHSAAAVAAHIEICALCEESVVALETAEDTLIGQLRSTGSQHDGCTLRPSKVDPVFAAAVARLLEPLDHGCRLLRHNELGEESSHPERVGDYEIIEPLARGGMGHVYRARHVRLEKIVALKLLPTNRVNYGQSVERFSREMKIIGQMNHPSIVAAFDAGDDRGRHYLAMEFIDGVDLAKLVRTLGPLDANSACEIVRQAAIGLQHAHERGVIHRDVKPSNLMLDGEGRVKLLDLGLAILSEPFGVSDELTTVGQLLGTLDYMAPEQCGDTESIDHRVDLYGLGATLYKLLTGVAPHDRAGSKSLLNKLRALATSNPISIRERSPAIDPQLAAVVMKCLAHQPSERCASSSELAQAVSPWANADGLSELVARAKTLRRGSPMTNLEWPACNVLPEYRLPLPQREDIPAATVAASSARSRFRLGRPIACAMALMGAAVWAGVTIILDYAGGRLVIESEVESVQVTILRDSETHRQLHIEQGTVATRLWAGEYRVQIDSPADQLSITNDVFELRRGQTVVARIKRLNSNTELPTPGLAAPELLTPRYGGMTLEQLSDDWFSDSLVAFSPGIRVLSHEMPAVQRQTWIRQYIEKAKKERYPPTCRKYMAYLGALPVDWPEMRLVLDFCFDHYIHRPHHDFSFLQTFRFLNLQPFYRSASRDVLDYLYAQLQQGLNPEDYPARAIAAIVILSQLATLEGVEFSLDEREIAQWISVGHFLLGGDGAHSIAGSDDEAWSLHLARILGPRLVANRDVDRLFRALIEYSEDASTRREVIDQFLLLEPQPEDIVELVLAFLEKDVGTGFLLRSISDHPRFHDRVRSVLRDREWGLTGPSGISHVQLDMLGPLKGDFSMSHMGTGGSKSGSIRSAVVGGDPSLALKSMFEAKPRGDLIAGLGMLKERAAPVVRELRQQLDWLTDPLLRSLTYQAIAAITGENAPPLFEGFELSHYLDKLSDRNEEIALAGVQAIKGFCNANRDDHGSKRLAIQLMVERAQSLDYLDPAVFTHPLGQALLSAFSPPRRGGNSVEQHLRDGLIEVLPHLPVDSAPFVFEVFRDVALSNCSDLYRFASALFDSESQVLQRRAWAVAFQAGVTIDGQIINRFLAGHAPPELKMAIMLHPRASGSVTVNDEWTDAEIATLFHALAQSRAISMKDNVIEQCIGRANRLMSRVEPLELDLWNGPAPIREPTSESRTLLEFFLDMLERKLFNQLEPQRSDAQRIPELIHVLERCRSQVDGPVQIRLDAVIEAMRE